MAASDIIVTLKLDDDARQYFEGLVKEIGDAIGPLAKRLKAVEDKIEEWERGEDDPTPRRITP